MLEQLALGRSRARRRRCPALAARQRRQVASGGVEGEPELADLHLGAVAEERGLDAHAVEVRAVQRARGPSPRRPCRCGGTPRAGARRSRRRGRCRRRDAAPTVVTSVSRRKRAPLFGPRRTISSAEPDGRAAIASCSSGGDVGVDRGELRGELAAEADRGVGRAVADDAVRARLRRRAVGLARSASLRNVVSATANLPVPAYRMRGSSATRGMRMTRPVSIA